MKRILSYLSLSALALAGASAAPLSPEQAFSRVQDIDSPVLNSPASRSADMPMLRKTLRTNDGQPAIYIFDNRSEHGYMVVSADDAAIPLLGYSDDGTFDPDNIPPALEYWLSEYQRQIEFARESGLSGNADTRAGITLPAWAEVGPLLKTQWNQTAPYNNLCPFDRNGNANSVTGCVATAMAQAMKYFNYPAKGQGSITYNAPGIGTLSMNFSDITFDWNNMLDSYSGQYSEAQATAVAQLMEACGYSVQMEYSATDSGAVSCKMLGALVNYFNYDMGVRYYTRDIYSYSDWAKMLYDNLKNIGPVVYDGRGSGGGHCWVCDGYRNGYFHFNWGWGGSSNGYYLLDALSPATLGVGGGAGNFNYDQSAIFNIQPNKNSGASPQSEMVLWGTITGEISGSILYMVPTGSSDPGWGYQGLNSAVFNLGAGYVRADSPNATPTYVNQTVPTNYAVDPGGYLAAARNKIGVNLAVMNLEDGVTYKVFTAYKFVNGNWQPMPAAVGSYNYVYVTKSNGRYTLQNFAPDQFSGVDITLNTSLYYNTPVKYTATIKNENSTDITRSFALVLLNSSDKLAFVGESYLITLGAGQTASNTWSTSFTRQSGQGMVTKDTEFSIGLYDTVNKILFYKSPNKVTMQPSPGAAKITLDISVEDSNPTIIPATGGGNIYRYPVKNARDFNVTTKINVISGYYTNSLTLCLFTPNTAGSGAYLTLSYPLGYIFLNEGETGTWTQNMDFANAVIGDYYWLGVLTPNGQLADGKTALTVAVDILGIGEPSGVESVISDTEELTFLIDRSSRAINIIGGNGIATVDAYYLNGMKAPIKVDYNGDNAFVSLSDLGKGIVVVTATDRNGKRKSTKIVL